MVARVFKTGDAVHFTVPPSYGPFVRLPHERWGAPFSGPQSPVLDTVCSSVRETNIHTRGTHRATRRRPAGDVSAAPGSLPPSAA